MLMTSSGVEVPNATTVRPMIRSLMPIRLAIAEAPSVRMLAPVSISARLATSQKTDAKRDILQTFVISIFAAVTYQPYACVDRQKKADKAGHTEGAVERSRE